MLNRSPRTCLILIYAAASTGKTPPFAIRSPISIPRLSNTVAAASSISMAPSRRFCSSDECSRLRECRLRVVPASHEDYGNRVTRRSRSRSSSRAVLAACSVQALSIGSISRASACGRPEKAAADSPLQLAAFAAVTGCRDVVEKFVAYAITTTKIAAITRVNAGRLRVGLAGGVQGVCSFMMPSLVNCGCDGTFQPAGADLRSTIGSQHSDGPGHVSSFH